jgi:hypothetical protein
MLAGGDRYARRRVVVAARLGPWMARLALLLLVAVESFADAPPD